MRVPIKRDGEMVWADDDEMLPGDLFKYKPIGGFVHWHEFIRHVTTADGLPGYKDRCVSGACNRRSRQTP